MLAWTTDEKGRETATDAQTRMLYRLSGDAPCELAVFPYASRRSCDRSVHEDVDTAKAYAEERVVHESELRALHRVRRQARTKTPWGVARLAIDHGEGVVLFSAPEQDGFHLAPETNALVPSELRLADGWYQEDGDGARVVLAMPHLFTSLERRDAVAAAREAFPSAFRKWRELGAEPGLRSTPKGL